MPKVSVILTSFNHEKYLRESIDSVLNQTFTDFELIVWDDASSDSSWEIINSYSDPRIKSFRNEVSRRGIYGINNSISEVATGEYIAIHHSDDIWALDKLEKQAAYLDGHSKIGAVFSNALAIGEDSQPLADEKHFYSKIFDKPNRTRHEWLRFFFRQGNALCHPSVLIRRTCYADCGLYRYGLAQLPDFDMWVRLCLKYEIHVLPEKLVGFRVRDNEANASGNRPDVRIRDRSEFHHVLKHYFGIDDFRELVSIFPEAEKYFSANGCEPRFVMAMVALGENNLPWANFLGIETLFDLITDASVREKIKSLYQFDYSDLIALTGKYDLFSLETVALQRQALSERDAIISSQKEIILQLTGRVQAGSVAQTDLPPPHPTSLQSGVEGFVNNRFIYKSELPSDREAYEKAAHLLESGARNEGVALLEELAEKGSSCWDLYNDLAVIYFNEGDNLRAVPFFKKGVELEGRSGTTARNFATMLLMTGDMEAALVVLGEMLHELPNDSTVLNAIGDVLSNINPLPADAWLKLVSDIRGGQRHRLVGQPGLNKSPLHKANQPVAENNIKIFQIFYDEASKLKLDPDFIPLDNTENLRPDWCEYWSIRKVLLNCSFDDDDYLGFFSARFSEKTGMDGKSVLEKMKYASDEVVSFSPYFDQAAIFPNSFVQGENFHPGLIETTKKVLSLLDVNLDLDSLICDQTTTIFSNYFVARYSFWKKWFEYTEKIFAVCEGPDCDLKTSLFSTIKHRKEGKYVMKVFVLERLVTIVMEILGISSKVGTDISKAPLLLGGLWEDFVVLMIFDALKSQYRKTGLLIYKQNYFMAVNRFLEWYLTEPRTELAISSLFRTSEN